MISGRGETIRTEKEDEQHEFLSARPETSTMNILSSQSSILPECMNENLESRRVLCQLEQPHDANNTEEFEIGSRVRTSSSAIDRCRM